VTGWIFNIVAMGLLTASAIGTAAKAGESSSTTVSAPLEPAALLVFGDSITDGYGLEREEAFPARLQERIAARGWPLQVVNGGLSGETTAAGLRRIGWLLKRRYDYVLLELGANDGLRGVALSETRKNLQAIIDQVKKAYPDVEFIIAGMRMPPNLGAQYTDEFAAIFPDLARKNGAALIPFLLEGVGGIPELNLRDGIHPTAAGHEILADNAWQVLEPLLASRFTLIESTEKTDASGEASH
jgi:acyl-CoA thioesterase-1